MARPARPAALRFVARLASTEPLLVVLDEAPRLTTGHADFADTVSAVWENQVRDQRLMLVLSGSAVAVTELAFWSRGGGDEALTGHPETRVFTPADLLESRPPTP